VEVLQEEGLQDAFNLFIGTREYGVVVFAAASGCRRGEVLALLLTDVVLTTGAVTVYGPSLQRRVSSDEPARSQPSDFER
jgi:integrase